METPWDAMLVIYFGGYANWEYSSMPFLFKMRGFHTEELAPWEERGVAREAICHRQRRAVGSPANRRPARHPGYGVHY